MGWVCLRVRHANAGPLAEPGWHVSYAQRPIGPAAVLLLACRHRKARDWDNGGPRAHHEAVVLHSQHTVLGQVSRLEPRDKGATVGGP